MDSFLITTPEVNERLSKLEEKIDIIYSTLVTNQHEKDELLSSEEARQLLGVSKSTWQLMRDRRQISFSQIGRKIYVRRSHINQYLNNHSIN